MGRLIDADVLKKDLEPHKDSMEQTPPLTWERIWRYECEHIDDAPTVDAVPVVRCKDCRYYRFHNGTFGKGWMCFENNTARHGDDYCSRGAKNVPDTNVGKMEMEE